MYSKEAIELYKELLKTASAPVDRELEKLSFPGGGLLRSLAGIGERGIARAGELTPAAESLLSHTGNLEAGVANKTRASVEAATAQAKKMQNFARNPGDIQAERIQRGLANSQARAAVPAAQAAEAAVPAAGEAATAQRGFSPAYAAGAGLAAGGVGYGAYGLGQHNQQQADKTQRNLAFGAGAATGLALPGILRGAANSAQSMSLTPSSLFPGGGY